MCYYYKMHHFFSFPSCINKRLKVSTLKEQDSSLMVCIELCHWVLVQHIKHHIPFRESQLAFLAHSVCPQVLYTWKDRKWGNVSWEGWGLCSVLPWGVTWEPALSFNCFSFSTPDFYPHDFSGFSLVCLMWELYPWNELTNSLLLFSS